MFLFTIGAGDPLPRFDLCFSTSQVKSKTFSHLEPRLLRFQSGLTSENMPPTQVSNSTLQRLSAPRGSVKSPWDRHGRGRLGKLQNFLCPRTDRLTQSLAFLFSSNRRNPERILRAPPTSGTFMAMDPYPPAPCTMYKPYTVVQPLHMKH